MIGKSQFSLSYALLELTCIGVALGLGRASWEPRYPSSQAVLFFGAILASSAAIGGLFGRMALGVYCTLGGFGMTILAAALIWSLFP